MDLTKEGLSKVMAAQKAKDKGMHKPRRNMMAGIKEFFAKRKEEKARKKAEEERIKAEEQAKINEYVDGELSNCLKDKPSVKLTEDDMVLLKEYFAIYWRYENCKSNKERKALGDQVGKIQDRNLSNGRTVWEFYFC